MKVDKTAYIGAFDIETTQDENGDAFAYAYIFKAKGGAVGIQSEPSILFMRMGRIAEMLEIDKDAVPLVASYNLGFDLVPVEAWALGEGWRVERLEHGGRVLAADFIKPNEETPAFRFWDVQPFVPEGLAKMGEVVGVSKLAGSLDYSKYRVPGDEFSREEVDYMAADVEIVDAFVQNLREWYPWIKPTDLGRTCLTNASVARLFMRRVAGPFKLGRDTALSQFVKQAHAEQKSASDAQKRLRREAYAGGFTFAALEHLWETRENVHHYDLDSAYHAYPIFEKVPTRWREIHPSFAGSMAQRLNEYVDEVRRKAAEGDWSQICYPGIVDRFHARIKIENVIAAGRVGTLGYLSARRFDPDALAELNGSGERSAAATARGLHVELGRVRAADNITITVDEYELAALALAYDWDALGIEAIEVGQSDTQLALPLLTSLMLRDQKLTRKQQGGEQYQMFKRVYNSVAGVYAQPMREGEFTLAHLPLAVRMTSSTRLRLLVAVIEAKAQGAHVLSGDTDSIKTDRPVDFVCREATARPGIIASHFGGPDKVEALCDGLGCFELERIAELHREMAQKQRAFISGGELVVKMAGVRTDRLAAALNARLTDGVPPRDVIEWLKPYTWLDMALAKRVQGRPPRATAPYLPARGNTFVYPAIALYDRPICLASPANLERLDRLALAGKLDGIQEGWLSEDGWEPFND